MLPIELAGRLPFHQCRKQAYFGYFHTRAAAGWVIFNAPKLAREAYQQQERPCCVLRDLATQSFVPGWVENDPYTCASSQCLLAGTIMVS